MSVQAISIGDAAKLSGVKIPTIRYYEQIGLLPPSTRTAANRRVYDELDLRRLAFIRHGRELGFDIDAIRTLLTLQGAPNQPCAQADAIARERLVDVDQRIASLVALRDELRRMLQECAHGRIADCRVIEVLADHSQCRLHVRN